MLLKEERVHHVSYLLATTIDLSLLKEDKFEFFSLKAGYEILSLSVEILTQGNGTIDIGITEAADYFLNDIDLAQLQTYKSSIETTIKSDTSLTLDTTARDGIIKVRMLYFTEGTMYK